MLLRERETKKENRRTKREGRVEEARQNVQRNGWDGKAELTTHDEIGNETDGGNASKKRMGRNGWANGKRNVQQENVDKRAHQRGKKTNGLNGNFERVARNEPERRERTGGKLASNQRGVGGVLC